MKTIKTLITLVTLFIATTCFGGNIIKNHEVWENKYVTYKFVYDSVYVDEKGNEGDGCTYELKGNCLYLDENGDKSVIVIVEMVKDYVWILVNNGLFKFERYECECQKIPECCAER